MSLQSALEMATQTRQPIWTLLGHYSIC